WFSGAEGSVKKADVHHLFVSNSSVNSSRGNLPFDVVINANNTFSSDPAYVSKRGTNANGKTVFEPADPHKGNLARALLYFHLRYGQSLSQGGVDMLDRLISWHNADPVDDHELARNALVYEHQNNRNPFVDHPEYVASIWGGAVATTIVQFSPASAEVNEGDGSVTLNVTITNPASTPTYAQIALSEGSSADVNNYTTQSITFPANSGVSQAITVGITDDDLLEGTETLVFSLINVSGGNSAAAGNYSSFNLTIIDNDIPVPVATEATAPSMSGFTANWNAISGITDFELDLSTSATFATFVSGYQELLVTGTSLDITGLNAGTTYYYRLRAVFNESAGLNSNVMMASTEAAVGLLLEENFNYTAGVALTSTDNWTAHSSGGTNTIFVTTNNLSYTGYPSVSGNAATLSSSGEDVNRTFPAQTSGKVYASFLVNVTSAKTTGDYIFHFGTENVSTSFFRGRVFIQKDTATDNFRFGLSNAASALDPAITTPYNYSYGNTYLVALRYDFVEGDNNDVVNMWINPSISSIEPAAHLTSIDAISSEPANLGSIALRQGNSSNAPALTIDGIRVASTWSHLFPSAPSVPIVEVLPTNLSGFSYVAGHGPSAEQSFSVNGINLTGNITLTAPANFEISTGSGQNFLATSPLILNHTAGVVNSTAIYVRLKVNLAVGDYANEQIVIASPGVSPNKSVSCSGSVTEAVIAPELFISEYIEGNVGNDKAIEIFNASGAEIDLSQFSVKLATNGGAWSTTGIALTGTLANHGVYVLANSGASAAILALADQTSTSLNHNGNDAIGLFYGSTLIDVIGVQGVDPGAGWPVAGVATATKDHTLIRKPSVIQGNTNWASSAGTNTDDSEWIVMPVNYFSDLGTHSFNSGDDLDTPVVTIVLNGANVELNWTAITGANSYRVESSDDPYAINFSLVGITSDTTYPIPATPAKKFFRVIALP
ncbi:MAG: endonuclease, partial [Candidatus Cloacimonetes bacterium]|nr:endonuclease [Candidatus Cloacimonadota bacterium]